MQCSDADIRYICNITKLSDIIDTLPNAEQFYIEEGGTNLSCGQKQRIVITRALLKKPKLLILDEATSNMPSEAEKDLLNAIKQAFPDITLLVVTHRVDSVQDFDKIIVMNNGELACRETKKKGNSR